MNTLKAVKNKKSVSYHEHHIRTLKNPKEAAAYMDAVLEDGDPRLLLLALKDLAESRGGMSGVAKRAKLNRVSLYRTLSSKGNPTIASITKILGAFELRLSVQPGAKTIKVTKAARG
ncbi:MAG: putative addiction module antidote protein [Nitrospinae bacterium]|nr:putative addiction module antidote protein [Nitrospinota bacterium]